MNKDSPNRGYLLIIIAVLFIVFFAKVAQEIMWLKVRNVNMSPFSMGLLIAGILCLLLFVGFVCISIYSFLESREQRFTTEEGTNFNLKIMIGGVMSLGLMIAFFIGFGLEMIRENGVLQEIVRQEMSGEPNQEIVENVVNSVIEISPLGIGLLVAIMICFLLFVACVGMGIYWCIEKRNNQSTKRRGIKAIVAGILFFTLMNGCALGFAIEFIRTNDWIREIISEEVRREVLGDRGLTITNHEMAGGNLSFWNLEILYATGEYQSQHILEIEDTQQILNIHVELEEGELFLHLIQEGIQTTLDISDLDQELEYSLKNFEMGELTLVLESSGLRNASVDISIE